MCASLLIASGASDVQVAHQMGHSKIETTKNIYGHLFAQDRASILAAMNQAVGYCRNGGALTLVGVVKGTLSWEDPEIHRRELTIRASRNATREDFDHVMASIRSGQVPADRLATHATKLDNVPVDLPRWAHERAGLIKAIITV